jgi:hypothetical protein
MTITTRFALPFGLLVGLTCAASVAAQTRDNTASAPSAPSGFSSEPIRLSPEEREAAIEAGAARHERELPINGLQPGVHGEVGMMIGTGGARGMYGSAAVPLGENGSAAFSFMTERNRYGRSGW